MALRFQQEGIAKTAFDTNVRNYVFTRTVPAAAAPAGVEFVRQPIKAFAAGLRAKPGKDTWMMGGAVIIASFLDEGEIDEFIISIIPVMIGEGIPLIAPRHRTVPLKLLASKEFSDGVVKLHYAVAK
jgi:dihydrofolate reductase